MNKIILIFALVCISQVWSAGTCNTEILSRYKFYDSSLTLPITTDTEVKYCQDLLGTGKESCCTVDAINSFQTQAEKLQKRLETIVAERDQILISTRGKLVPALKKNLQRIQSVSGSIGDLFGSANGALGDGGSSGISETDFSSLEQIFEMAPYFTDDYEQFKEDFTTYQEKRAACITEMINLQAAAWCLACTPDGDGVDTDGSIFPSEDTTERIAGSCYEFFELSVRQGMIVSLQIMAPILEAVATAFEQISKVGLTDSDALEEIINGLDFSSITTPTDDTELPPRIDGTCDESGCTFIFDKIFTKEGVINEAYLGAGGKPTNPTEQSEDTKNRRRMLDPANLWTPDANEANIDVQFSTNPGNVENVDSSAGLIKGAVICALGLFMTLII